MALVPKASVADLVDHIDYIARRIGWEHVGIGTDFDHGGGITGFESEADAPNITREMLRRGYSEAQIRGIWGGNFLRVLAAAQAGRRP
jgi:membrane dipeptidase